ncbi:hypothetical protein OTU49_015135 [Cherax quadricarinatus]|uniref:Uncharacterized protein n=1 Tax=Cherax quadricarinatus TaxID=27406 RepID=A0AAW0XZU6_CHEQU
MSIKCGADKRDEILRQTAKEYSEYLEVDATSERCTLDRELESMLTRLEEYGSLLERTRSESRHTLDVLVPQVYSNYQKKDQYPVRTPTSSQLSFQPPQIFHAEDYFTRDVQKTDASSLMLPQ